MRYVRFVVDALHVDFGRSYVQPIDVERNLVRHVWLTGLLVVAALALWRGAGPSVVFGVLAVEAALGLPGLGRDLARAVDAHDVVMLRAVLAVVLVGCVFVPRRAPRRPRRWTSGVVTAAGVWLFALVLVIAFAHRLPIPDPATLSARHAAPSVRHWLGTDDVGRDVLARIVWGAQGTALLAAVATVAGGVIGMIIGALVAENRRAARVVTNAGAIGIPAIAVSVGLAAMLGRGATVYWEWLVPVTIGSAVAWGASGLTRATGGVAALCDGAANAVTAILVLGALGLVPPQSALTLGTIVNDGRIADHRSWLPLIAAVAVAAASVAALRVIASWLRRAPASSPQFRAVPAETGG